jgi:outer membrane protein
MKVVALSCIITVIASSLICGIPGAYAVEETDTIPTMTLGSAVQEAMNENPVVLQAREKVNELASTLKTAFSQLFPNLSAYGNGNYKKDPLTNQYALFGGQPYNMYNAGLQITQPIYSGNLLSGGIGVAKSQQNQAEISFMMSQRDTTLAVIAAFYNVVFAERNVDILKENMKVDEDLLKVIKNFERTGRAQLLDVLQVKTQIALLVPQIAQAENQVKINAYQLATTIGERNARMIDVRGTLDPPNRKAIDEDVKNEKLRIFEIELAEEQIKQVQEQKDVTLAKELPNFNATVNWERSAYVKTDLLDEDATTWTVALNLTVPIFSGLSSVYERRTAASQEAEADYNKLNAQDQANLAQIQDLKTLDTSESTVAFSEKAFEIAGESLKEAMRMYRLGTSNLQQYLQNEQSYLQAEVTLEQAKYNYLVNLSKYYSAIGYPVTNLVRKMENRS